METKELWLKRLEIYDQQQFDSKIIYCCLRFNELLSNTDKITPSYKEKYIERIPQLARTLLYNKSLMEAENTIVIEDDMPHFLQ